MNTQERIENLLNEIRKPENDWLKVKILDFRETGYYYQFEFESLENGILSYQGHLNIDETLKFLDIFKDVADYEGISGFEYEIIMMNVAKRLNDVTNSSSL